MSATLIASNCSTGSPSASPDWTSIRSELLIACRSSPALAKKLGYLHRDATWKTAVFGLTFRGHLEMLRGWDQFLEVAEDYRVTLREVEDLGGDRVLAAIDRFARAKHRDRDEPTPPHRDRVA